MMLGKSNNGAKQARMTQVGDRIEHTNSHRIGHVREIRPCRDGTVEMRVDIDFDDIWWNSRHVMNLTAEEEVADE